MWEGEAWAKAAPPAVSGFLVCGQIIIVGSVRWFPGLGVGVFLAGVIVLVVLLPFIGLGRRCACWGFCLWHSCGDAFAITRGAGVLGCSTRRREQAVAGYGPNFRIICAEVRGLPGSKVKKGNAVSPECFGEMFHAQCAKDTGQGPFNVWCDFENHPWELVCG